MAALLFKRSRRLHHGRVACVSVMIFPLWLFSALSTPRSDSSSHPQNITEQRASLLNAGPGSRLVEPDRIEPNHVKDAEIFVGVVTLHMIIPDVVDPLPRDRQ